MAGPISTGVLDEVGPFLNLQPGTIEAYTSQLLAYALALQDELQTGDPETLQPYVLGVNLPPGPALALQNALIGQLVEAFGGPSSDELDTQLKSEAADFGILNPGTSGAYRLALLRRITEKSSIDGGPIAVSTLLATSDRFFGLPPGIQMAVQNALLARLVGVVNQTSDSTMNVDLRARWAQFSRLQLGFADAVRLALLARAAEYASPAVTPSDTPFDTFDSYPRGGIGFGGKWVDTDVITYSGDNFSEYAIQDGLSSTAGGENWVSAGIITNTPDYSVTDTYEGESLVAAGFTAQVRGTNWGYEEISYHFDGSSLNGFTQGSYS